MTMLRNRGSFRLTNALLMICVFASSPVALGWNPFKSVVKGVKSVGGFIGGVVGAPVGGFVGAATAPTIRNAEAAGMRVTDHLNDQMKERIKQMDEAMANRISQFDGSLRDRIIQADDAAKERIKHLDGVFKDRIDQVDGVMTRAVNNVDVVLKQNIEKFDQVAETRIGTLDVVASKASLSFEQSFIRVIGAGCILVFVSFVVWNLYRMWSAVQTPGDKVPLFAVLSGLVKTKTIRNQFFGQVAGAGVALVLLFLIVDYMPGGAKGRQKELASVYISAYDRAYTVFDLDRARFLAAQLEAVDPTDMNHRARFLKTELIRDVFSRPALVQTVEGLNELYGKVSQLENYDQGSDPDVPALKAYLQWQIAADRDDELEAVKFAADSIELGQKAKFRGFLLLPLVSSYVNAYVAAPRPGLSAADATRLTTMANLADKQLKSAGPQSFPALANVQAFNTATQKLDEAVSDDYRDMLFEHATVVRLRGKSSDRDKADLKQAQGERARLANKIVDAWESFDTTLRTDTFLQGSATPLAAFGLNDAVYATARWFMLTPDTDKLPPLLVVAADDIHKDSKETKEEFYAPGDEANRVKIANDIAPMRIRWRDRYNIALGKLGSGVLEMEEFQRYRRLELVTRRMEYDVVKYYVVAEDTASTTWTRLERGVTASKSAAALGWYVTDVTGASKRLPLAKVLFDEMWQNKLDPAAKASFEQDKTTIGRTKYDKDVSDELNRRRDTTI